MNRISSDTSLGVFLPSLRDVPVELRRKYDTRGPRYTSYPPANHFGPVSPGDVAARWRAAIRTEGAEAGLYIHVPFCKTRCAFCGCHTVAGAPPSTVDGYLAALDKELETTAARLGHKMAVTELSLGGGSPNHLTTSQLSRLLDAIEKRVGFSRNAERSIELDPRHTTKDQVALLSDRGFNRFSMGVQDFDRRVLDLSRAGQSPEHVEALMDALRTCGHDAVNFDLVCGLPHQTVETAEATAQRTVSLGPSRVALYGFALLDDFLPHQKSLRGNPLPSADEAIAIRATMSAIFIENGYVPVGMDHFARPSDDLVAAAKERRLGRTFMGYTVRRDLNVFAAGPSAIAGVGSAYSQNHKDLDGYIAACDRAELPIKRGHLLNRDDEIRREVIRDLACNFAVSFPRIRALYGISPVGLFRGEIEQLETFESDGLLSVDEDGIVMTDTGRLFVRNACMVFDRYLKNASPQTYSRTLG